MKQILVVLYEFSIFGGGRTRELAVTVHPTKIK
jgi:hypothetical protein